MSSIEACLPEFAKRNFSNPIDKSLKISIIYLSHLPRVEGVFEDVLLIQGVFCYYKNKKKSHTRADKLVYDLFFILLEDCHSKPCCSILK